MNSLQIAEKFRNMPDILTERLRLTKMSLAHTSDMFEYASDPSVTKYLLWAPHENRDYTKLYLKQVRDGYKNGTFYDWAVTLRSTGKMIGTCGYVSFDQPNNTAEVGYVLNPRYRGQGYAPEALAAVIRYGFEVLRVNRIQARFIRGNDASLRVMEKVGMTFEGYLRKSMYIKDGYKDIGYAAITYDEYTVR